MSDTSVKKVNAKYSPTGELGQKYLASGISLGMRLWENEEHQALVCRAASHPGKNNFLINLRMPAEKGIVGWVARNGESLITPSTRSDPRFASDIDNKTGFTTQSMLATPLRVRNEVIGVLEVVNKIDGEFSEDDMALVDTLGAFAAIAIDNARLVDRLQQRTEDLQKRNQELDAFAHTVAHDIKNPLSRVVGFAETLEVSASSMPSESLQYYLKVLARNAWKIDNARAGGRPLPFRISRPFTPDSGSG